MKNQIATSKKDLSRKKRARNYSNYRTAIQLYAFYKADTIIKTEPRIPLNDPRRPAPLPKTHPTLLSYLKRQFAFFFPSLKASGGDLSHTVPSLLRNQ